MIRVGRLLRHCSAIPWQKRMMFPRATIRAIEDAIDAAQRMHTGVIRFMVEGAFPLRDSLGDAAPRRRAAELFALQGLWDTAARNGVLIYVLTADRSLEIVADRGIAARVTPADWEGVCRLMEQHFRNGRFRAGGVAAVDAVAGLLARHFPTALAAPAAPASRLADPLPHQPTLL